MPTTDWSTLEKDYCRTPWPTDPEQIHHSMPLVAHGVRQSSHDPILKKTPLILFCEANNISHHDRAKIAQMGNWFSTQIAGRTI